MLDVTDRHQSDTLLFSTMEVASIIIVYFFLFKMVIIVLIQLFHV